MAKLMGKNFFTQEQEFLSLVSDDYVALAEMISIAMGTNKYIPIEKDYLTALDLIKYLMDKYGSRLKYYIGPGVENIDKTPEEFIAWLKEIWDKGEYYGERMDYSIWFDLEPAAEEEK